MYICSMKASDNVKDFIKGQEGLRLDAYKCPAGIWTIGYGHTGTDVRQGKHIDLAEADRLFDLDLSRFERELTDMLNVNGIKGLTQGQYDALLSFAYNLGISKLRGSTLWRKVKANVNDPTIPDEFKRWVYAGGVKLLGLERRRTAEAAMWKGENV